MNTETQTLVWNAIVKMAMPKTSYTWEDVVEAVKASGVDKPHWMSVRGLMQNFNKRAGYARTDDLRTETFAR